MGSQRTSPAVRKSSVNTSQFYSSRSLTTKHELPCDRSVLSFNDIGHCALLLRGAPFIFRGHRRGNFSGDFPFFAKQSFSRARLFPPLLCAAHRQPRTSLSAIASCSPFKTLGTAFLRGHALHSWTPRAVIPAHVQEFFSWARLLFPPLCAAAHQPEQRQGPCDARGRSELGVSFLKTFFS